MEQLRDVVIVGGGRAAAEAVRSLRDAGYDGRLTLVSAEPVRPYDRPPLSKSVLLGTEEPASAFLEGEDFHASHDVELVLDDPVVRIDRDRGTVETRAALRLPFDRLLLATGAAPRHLAVDGAGLEGVVTLRTMHDSVRLRDALGVAGHVTVVGAGWIGCEVAAAARSRGVATTMIDPLRVPLERTLGTELGGLFADLHRDHGVDLRPGRGVVGFEGTDRIEGVRLDDGTVVATELVVVGIGAAPRTELAAGAGLPVDDGIEVDATLTTADPRILAAGDVARAWHPFYGRSLRVEHWDNALQQGSTAGRNVMGAGETYERLPYFFSDQYDLGMEYVGHAPKGAEVVVRGSVEDRELVAFWLHDRRVVAGMNVNVWDVVEPIRELIASRRRVDPSRLADPQRPLETVG